jgi:hypothetical protein
MPHHLAFAHPDYKHGQHHTPSGGSTPKKGTSKRGKSRNSKKQASHRSSRTMSSNSLKTKPSKKALLQVPSAERNKAEAKPVAKPIGRLKIPLSARISDTQRSEIMGTALKIFARHSHRGHEEALNAGQRYIDRRVRELTNGKTTIKYSVRAARKTTIKPIKSALGNPRKHQA